jgi:hypothetical protein
MKLVGSLSAEGCPFVVSDGIAIYTMFVVFRRFFLVQLWRF